MSRRVRVIWPLAIPAAALLLFIALPVVALAVRTVGPDFLAGIRDPLVGPALSLSAFTTTTSLLVIVSLGTPLAWLVARSSGGWARWIATVVQLPIVLPPAVAGVALLLAFGRLGLLGQWLDVAGVHIAFTTAAVVMAEVFAAAPFYLQAAIAAFRRIDEGQLVVARSLGASPLRAFFQIALPLAAPGLITGAALSWARALGEFGATLMFAGNVTGRTQTLPLAVYTAMESDLRAAQAISLVIVLVAFGLLLLISRTRVDLHARR